MPCSYMEGNTVFRSKVFEMYLGIFRGVHVTKNMYFNRRFNLLTFWLSGEHLNHCTKFAYIKILGSSQKPISRQSSRWISEYFIIYNGMCEFGKIQSTSGGINWQSREDFYEIFVILFPWNSSEISEGEEIFLQLLRQCMPCFNANSPLEVRTSAVTPVQDGASRILLWYVFSLSAGLLIHRLVVVFSWEKRLLPDSWCCRYLSESLLDFTPQYISF
jgi:hypothetical protein